MSDSSTASADAQVELAVMAHDILDSLTGVVVAAHTLRRVEPGVPPADWLLEVVIERSEHIVHSLQDVLRGMPHELLSQALLDSR